MQILIPDWVTDEGVIPYVAGCLHGSNLNGDGETVIEVLRNSYRPGVPANLYSDAHGFKINIPREGISLENVLECCRQTFCRFNS